MYNKNTHLIVLNYHGTIRNHANVLLESSILYQVKINQGEEIKGILISCKNLIYDGNSNSVSMMVKQLNKLSEKLEIFINLVDYSMELYPVFKKATRNTKVKLFKNMSAANLFLDPHMFKQKMRVLVYDEDEENSIKLSKELSKYGYTIVRAKDLTEFNLLMNDTKEHDIVITHSVLNMDFKSSNSVKGSLSLSKKLIINLPVFMDTAVETLVSFTGLKAEKSAHGIKQFDISLQTNIISAVMHFNGDIDGFFILVFPTDIAIIALESLLGESVSEDDVEILQDGVGEFCNIITGSTKTAFSKKDLKVVFDLPKTFLSLKETHKYIGKNSGIWVDMRLADKPFYMFITK